MISASNVITLMVTLILGSSKEVNSTGKAAAIASGNSAYFGYSYSIVRGTCSLALGM